MSKNKKRSGLLLILALIALVVFIALPALRGEEPALTAPGLQELQELRDELTELPPAAEDGGASTDPVLSEDPAHADAPDATTEQDPTTDKDTEPLPEDGSYTSKEDVSAYLIAYGHLPDNFITKKQAQQAGWPGGSLEPYCPGKCIGGDRFGNREGLLPSASGRIWTECDIDTLGSDSRGAKRLVFSNDGLIYYTEDHYESFQLVYGEP